MPISKDQFDSAETSVHSFLVRQLKEFYKTQNYAIYEEKKLGRFLADLILIRDETLTIAIEAKPSNASEIRKGVGQAHSYLDWVHEVYLAVPSEGVNLSKQLLKYSPVGIVTITDQKVTFVKEANRSEPSPPKLSKLLNDTVGFCWICGRTFNVVRPSQKQKETLYIAHKEIEPNLFRTMEKLKGKKIRTKGSWVSICTVCSRIVGAAISEFLLRVLKDEKFPNFDFEEYQIEEVRKKLTDSK